MWIRSQDKKRLVKANYVRINGTTIEAIHSDMLCTSLATYSTEEKALEVLDMIEETIKGKLHSYYSIEEYGKSLVKNEYYENTSNIVFQMPQDSDV